MKERLDDLLNDADKTLLELDATGRAGNSSTTEENEVDRDTAMRFNHTPTEMKSAFWRRYPRFSWLLVLFLLLIIAASTYMTFTMPKAEGHYRLATATVQSSGLYSGRLRYRVGGATATLILQNGNMVVVQADPNAIPPAGMRVLVRLYDTGAVRLERQN
jgi:hypothetical protein